MGRHQQTSFSAINAEQLSRYERQVPVELYLPAAHPKQAELINAFDARRTPDGRVIFNPGTGGFEYASYQELPLAYPDLKFIVGACGTKFGKTYGCSILITRMAWEVPESLNWWVAPSYKPERSATSTVHQVWSAEISV